MGDDIRERFSAPSRLHVDSNAAIPCTHAHRLLVGIVTGRPTYWTANDGEAMCVQVTPRDPTIVLFSSPMRSSHLSILKGYEELGTIGFIDDIQDNAHDEEATHDLTMARAAEVFRDITMADLHSIPSRDLFAHILQQLPVIDRTPAIWGTPGTEQPPGGIILSAVTFYTEYPDPVRPYGHDNIDTGPSEDTRHIVWKWAKPDSYYGKLNGPWGRHLPEVLTGGGLGGGRDLQLMAKRVDDATISYLSSHPGAKVLE